MRKSSRLRLLAASGAALISLAATACGPDGSTASPAGSAASSGSTAGAPAALQAVDSRQLGTIVVDSQGRTLYRFDKDTAHPSASHCTGGCAAAWPPATVQDAATVKGIDKALVGTVKRADGTRQLTLGGWPLYRFAKDARPGDTKGEGVGGTWFAADPQGGKARPATGGTTGYSSGNSSGYSSGY